MAFKALKVEVIDVYRDEWRWNVAMLLLMLRDREVEKESAKLMAKEKSVTKRKNSNIVTPKAVLQSYKALWQKKKKKKSNIYFVFILT